MTSKRVLTCLVVACSAWAAPHSAAAQEAAPEVQWRTDYHKARQEAVEKGRPLLIDFTTKPCVWCDRLEAETFRTSPVASLLNDRFVPLKIDARTDTWLVEQLKVQSYPTCVLASPDGKILATQEGFLEAGRFHELLQRALAAVANPEWMARDYEAATKAVAAADYARAVALLKSILEDRGARPIQVKAKQLLGDLEQQAAGRLARAKQYADKGQTEEAITIITELVRTYAGTQAAAEGGQTLSSLARQPEMKDRHRARRARELLAQAREDYRTKQYLCCLERCEVLATSYADLGEGAEASQLAAEIRNNPEWMKQACETMSDRLGKMYFQLAETWLKKGQPQQAILCLERVVQAFPNTRQAEAAQVRLAQIQGLSTQPVDFKKQ